jgi:hypothetical protein
MNCEIPFPANKFFPGLFWLVQNSDAAILAKVNYFLVLSFHLSLFVLFQSALLPG